MDLYKEDVMDHYENPRNQGEIEGEGVVRERDSNASCGDMIEFFIKSDKGVIKEAKWRGVGCAISTAAASKLSVYLQGRTLKEVQAMSEEELLKTGVGLEVSPGRMKCLILPVKVVKTIVGSLD